MLGLQLFGNEEKVDSESLTPNRPYNSSFVSHLCHHLVLGIMAISHGHLQTHLTFRVCLVPGLLVIRSCQRCSRSSYMRLFHLQGLIRGNSYIQIIPSTTLSMSTTSFHETYGLHGSPFGYHLSIKKHGDVP